MKVDMVYILRINGGGDLDEISNAVEGVLSKCGAKDIGRLIVVDPPQLPNAGNWKTLFDTDEYLTACKQTISEYQGVNVGLYVVSHGSGAAIGGVNAEGVAALINELNFPHLRKICVVACNTANSLAQGEVSTSFLGEIASKIARLTPMIAGYKGWITPAYSGTKDAQIRVEPQPLSGTHAKGAELERVTQIRDQVRSKGSTLFRPTGLRGRVAPLGFHLGEKSSVKFVVRKVGDTVVAVQLAEWHDN
jgi:hypothetical protein